MLFIKMMVLSNILESEKLISYYSWSKYIDSLRTDEIINNEKQAVSKLKIILMNAVKKRIPKEKFGILFSGGIDSTLIAYLCKKFSKDFVCYTVGIEGSQDIEFARKVSKKLNLPYKEKVFSIDEIRQIFEKTATVLGHELINIVNLGVGSVELAAIKLAKQDNLKSFFSGLGSEEIFAGYQRHENSKNINEECWHGLKTMWKRDLKRDYAISQAYDIVFLTPFLDKDLITEAMKISGDLKIKSRYKKYILRKTALELGLDKDFAFRKKKAAQYGSNFDKAILKIAKSNGYKYKQGYLDYLKKNK